MKLTKQLLLLAFLVLLCTPEFNTLSRKRAKSGSKHRRTKRGDDVLALFGGVVSNLTGAPEKGNPQIVIDNKPDADYKKNVSAAEAWFDLFLPQIKQVLSQVKLVNKKISECTSMKFSYVEFEFEGKSYVYYQIFGNVQFLFYHTKELKAFIDKVKETQKNVDELDKVYKKVEAELDASLKDLQAFWDCHKKMRGLKKRLR